MKVNRPSPLVLVPLVLLAMTSACRDINAGPAADQAAAQERDGVVHYVRFESAGEANYGILDGQTIRELSGAPYDNPPETGRTFALSDVRLLAPVEPEVVLGLGSQFGGLDPEETPVYFAKLPGSIIGTEEAIYSYPGQPRLFYETEVAVVIGRTAQNVSPEEAPDYIFGVAAGNDVSDRDWQSSDGQWFRGKSADTWGPIGPAVVTGLDYNNLDMVGRLNGEVVQSANTSELNWDIPRVVSYISRWVTLNPGDVIFAGTPDGAGELQPGDVFEVEVEGVGVLRNTVVSVDGPGGGNGD